LKTHSYGFHRGQNWATCKSLVVYVHSWAITSDTPSTTRQSRTLGRMLFINSNNTVEWIGAESRSFETRSLKLLYIMAQDFREPGKTPPCLATTAALCVASTPIQSLPVITASRRGFSFQVANGQRVSAPRPERL